MHHADEIEVDRFKVVRKLGEGATSEVVEVIDCVRGGRFALKRLREQRHSLGYVSRFKDEYRSLQGISHPNLAKVYELIDSGGGLSLLMELIEGDDLLSYVRPGWELQDATLTVGPGYTADPSDHSKGDAGAAPGTTFGGTLSLARLRATLPHVVAGIRALHEEGWVHCDLKPQNVVVTPAGRAVIVDFGLVTNSEHASEWRGTPAFMPPEQFDGIHREANDWYALGAVLYTVLTGRLLNPSDSRPGVARRLAVPIDPRAFDPSVPDDLADLAMRLLDPDPTRRPDGEEVARSVGMAQSGLGPRPEKLGRFVGRQQELTSLARAFDRAREGSTQVVHLLGESGIGKSTLVRRFAQSEAERGATLFWGGCYRDALVPYNGLDSLMDAVAKQIEREGLDPSSRLSVEDARSLATMFPVFVGVLTAELPIGGRTGTDPSDLRHRAANALRGLLARWAQRSRGVLCCIDDVQWSDPSSVEFLSRVVAQPVPGLLWVLAYRTSGAEPDRHAALVCRRLPGTVLPLPPLPEPDLCEMIRGATRFSREEARALVRESGGNPFFLEELLRADAPGLAGGPASVGEVVLRRVERLPATERSYLEMVAVSGRPVEERVLTRALGTSPEEARALQRNLTASSFVKTEGFGSRAVSTYHDRLREFVVARLDPIRIRECHERLAHAHEASGDAEPEILAVHYEAAGCRDKAAGYMEAAGDATFDALAFDRAAELYRAAMEALDGDDATRLREKLASTLSWGGRPAQAAAVFQQLAAARPDDAELAFSCGDERLKAGDIDGGLWYLRRLAARLGEWFPERRLLTVVAVLLTVMRLGLTRLGLLPRTRRSELTRQRLNICLRLSHRLVHVDYLAATLFSLRHLRLALASASRPDTALGLGMEACLAAMASVPWGLRSAARRAERLIRRSESLAAADDSAEVRGTLRFAEAAALHFPRARWQRAEECFDESLRVLRSSESAGPHQHWNTAICHCALLENLRAQGDFLRMRARLEASLVETLGHRVPESFLRLRGSVTIALLEGDVAGASAIVRDVSALWVEQPVRLPHYFGSVAETEIALYAGEEALASSRLQYANRALRTTWLAFNAYYMAVHQSLLARVYLRAGEPRRARRAIERLAREQIAWAPALSEALRGCLLVQRDRVPEGRRRLERAVKRLEELAMPVPALVATHQHALLADDAAARTRAAEAMQHAGIHEPERYATFVLPLVRTSARRPLGE